MNIDIQLKESPLSAQEAINYCTRSASGAINVFIGTVRDKTKGKEVVRLEFESYETMALKEMRMIAEKACQRWNIAAVFIHHRIGTLLVSEIPVVIAVSTAHRAASFEACHYIIDQLKETVPIWKKEIFVDGEFWVSANP